MTRHSPSRRGRQPGGSRPDSSLTQDPLWLYGRHAVGAALANPARRIKRLVATKNAQDWLEAQREPLGFEAALLGKIEDEKPAVIDRLLPDGAVHQGLALLTNDLPRARLKEACAITTPEEDATRDPAGVETTDVDHSHLRPVIVLDQITDPQNIGAIYRSAAAFNAAAVVVQERRTPPLAGALAKAAAGALETVPCVKVVNIARALEALQDLGYHCAGLAGDGGAPIFNAPNDKPLAIVLGAEGKGLRDLVAATCDKLYNIPMAPAMESLNVSNAAAIALYETMRRASSND